MISLGWPVTWPNRILLAALIAAAVAFLPQRDNIEPEDLARVNSEREQLRVKVERLRREVAGLHAEVRALHRPLAGPGADEGELARIARSDLNLIKPGEVVFEIAYQGGEP